jgi:hypothetical protein
MIGKFDIWDSRNQRIIAASGIFLYLIFHNPRKFYAEAFQNQQCVEEVEVQQMEFNGIIEKAFLDSSNHLYHTLTVKEDGESKTSYVDPIPDELWYKLTPGTRLLKQRDSLNFYIRTTDCRDTIRLSFNCH